MSELNFSIKLDRWAREQGLSYALNYSEKDDVYEVEVTSSIEVDCYYSKRNYVFESFLNQYKNRAMYK